MLAWALSLLLSIGTTGQTAANAGVASRTEDQLQESFKRATDLQQRGQWEEAASAWREFITRAPKHAGAQANYGAVLARLGRYDEAVASYETALRLEPSLTAVYYNLGIAHYRA